MKELNLRFLNSFDNKSIPFLPYGVTTIEFAIDGKCKSGHIRPKNSTLHDPKKREYAGFAENTEDFLVVWGAGIKKGQYVKKNSTDRMFMQLIHLNGEHTKATIVFEHTGLFNKKKLEVYKPQSAPAMDDVFKMVTEVNDSNVKTTCLKGTHMPIYYPRWFPPKEIKYVNPANYPQICIEYTEDESGIASPIEVFSEVQGQNRKICTVKGDLRYARLHAELFVLFQNKNIFVLRLWLYWTHKRYVKGLLDASVGYSADAGASTLGVFDSATGIEIPDIERFDFIIDAGNNRIILYGTDIHYQEYWGKVSGPLVEAKIAKDVDLFTKTGELITLRFIQDSPYYNPIDAVKDYILSEQKTKGFETVVANKKAPEELKKLGGIRTHVPYVEQGMIGGKPFLSSDSRRGAKI